MKGLKNSGSDFASINTMTVYDNELYVGGYYDSGGTIYQTVAKYNSKENKFDEITGGLKNSNNFAGIYTMTVYDNELYVGGSYRDDSSGTTYQYVAKYNKQTNRFDERMKGLKSDIASIETMKVYDNEFYVGGSYRQECSGTTYYLIVVK